MDVDTPSPSRGETTPQSGHPSGGALGSLQMYGTASEEEEDDAEDAVVPERPRRAASRKPIVESSDDDEVPVSWSEPDDGDGSSSSEEEEKEATKHNGRFVNQGKSALASDRIQVLDMEGQLIKEIEGKFKTVADVYQCYQPTKTKLKDAFQFSKYSSWKPAGKKAYYGAHSTAAPGLDDKEGWIKQFPARHLPERLRLDDRQRPRQIRHVFIHYLGKPAAALAVSRRSFEEDQQRARVAVASEEDGESLTPRRRVPVHKSNCRDASPPWLNHDLHAIDATPAGWRVPGGLSPLDSVIKVAFSSRKDLVKNYRVHPTHWLIYAQVRRTRSARMRSGRLRTRSVRAA